MSRWVSGTAMAFTLVGTVGLASGCYTALRGPRANVAKKPEVVKEWASGDRSERDIARMSEDRDRRIDRYDPLRPSLQNPSSYPGDYDYYYDGLGAYRGYGYPSYGAYRSPYGYGGGYYIDPRTGYAVPYGYQLVPEQGSSNTGAQGTGTQASSQTASSQDKGASAQSDVLKGVEVPPGYELVEAKDDPLGYRLVPQEGALAPTDPKAAQEEKRRRPYRMSGFVDGNIAPRPATVGRSPEGVSGARPSSGQGVRGGGVSSPKPVAGASGSPAAGPRPQSRPRKGFN